MLLHGRRGARADADETQKISEAIIEVIKNVQDRSSGAGAAIVNVLALGGVDRSAEAAREAAIRVIKKRVPGVTKRIVRAMHVAIPIGLSLMIGGSIIAMSSNGENAVYYYLGIPIGAYVIYSPIGSEVASIRSEAEDAGQRASSSSFCVLQ